MENDNFQEYTVIPDGDDDETPEDNSLAGDTDGTGMPGHTITNPAPGTVPPAPAGT